MCAAYFDTGFSVRQTPWHGLGNVLDEYPSDWAEARKMAGLEWEPAYADLWVEQLAVAACRSCVADLGDEHDEGCPLDGNTGRVSYGHCTPEGSIFAGRNDAGILCHVPVEGHQAIVRSDTRAVLATPKDSWTLISHDSMGELLDSYTAAWRQQGADVKFETAGSLKGGTMVWALAWLDEPVYVPGDDSPTYPFVALTNYHDGTGSCRLFPTSVRIVCWNTWHAAEYGAERDNAGIVLRHTANVAERIEDAKVALGEVRNQAKEWAMVAADLAGININDAVVRTFLDEFIPIPEGASERTRNARAERQSTFMRLYTDSPTVAPLPNTAYKLMQAGGEYLDHLRPFRSRDTYLSRTMFSNEPVKRGTIKLVRKLAKDLA